MSLNLPQRAVLSISALGILIMILFPPTCYRAYREGHPVVFSGYQFIGKLETNTTSKSQVYSLVNPEERVSSSIYHIEPVRLSFQLAGTLLVTSLMLLIFHQNTNQK